MHLSTSSPQYRANGFSLVEILLVTAVIGILSTLIIASITGAASDSRTIIARQQQAALQAALNAWTASASSGSNSLANARSNYAAASSATAKLALLEPYLQASTFEHFTNYSTASAVGSEALQKIGASLQFSEWNSTNYPTVIMITP